MRAIAQILIVKQRVIAQILIVTQILVVTIPQKFRGVRNCSVLSKFVQKKVSLEVYLLRNSTVLSKFVLKK